VDRSTWIHLEPVGTSWNLIGLGSSGTTWNPGGKFGGCTLLIWQVPYSENSSQNPPGSDWFRSEPVGHSKDLPPSTSPTSTSCSNTSPESQWVSRTRSPADPITVLAPTTIPTSSSSLRSSLRYARQRAWSSLDWNRTSYETSDKELSNLKRNPSPEPHRKYGSRPPAPSDPWSGQNAMASSTTAVASTSQTPPTSAAG